MNFQTPLLACAVALALSGCASMDSPDYSGQAERHTGENIVWADVSEQARTVTSLKAMLPQPVVAELIEQALTNNPGLQQTLVILQQSQVQQNLAAARRRPQVSASVSANKQQDSNTAYTGALNVSWELDIWQRIGDQIDAASWNTQSARADYIAARDTLAANVMRAYLQIITQQQLLNIEQQRLAVLENNEAVILARYKSGLGSLDDLDSARTSTARTRADIASAQAELKLASRALAVLTGQPQATLTVTVNQQSLPDVVMPLPTFAQQDLSRRPDVQAAFATIKATEAQVSVAQKALYPSLDISGALTDSDTRLSQALLTDPVWSVLGQITAPLFQGGQLRANIEAAKLDALSGWWTYQQTLLTAVQEVQDAIDLEHSYQQQQRHYTQAYDNAKRSADTYASKYRQGLVDILDLLSVYQTEYDLQAQLVQLQFSQLSNRIDLGLALGLGVSS